MAKQPKVHGRRRKGEAISRLHLRVVDEYMKDFNKSAALERAGYEKPVASRRIFERPEVEAEIERRRAKAAKKAEITKDLVVAEVAKMAFGKLTKFLKITEDGKLTWDFTGATPEELEPVEGLQVEEYVEGRGQAAQKVKRVKVSERDRLRAVAELNRMLGYYAADQVHVQGELSIVERLNKGRERLRQPEKADG